MHLSLTIICSKWSQKWQQKATSCPTLVRLCVITREESERRTKSLNTPLSSVNSVLFAFKRNDLPLYYNLVLWVMYPLNVWKLFSWFGVCFVFLKALLEMCFCLKVSPFVAKINLSSRCIEHIVCVAEWLFLMDVTPSPTTLPPTHPYRLMRGQVFLFLRCFIFKLKLVLISSLIPCVCGSQVSLLWGGVGRWGRCGSFNWTVGNTWCPMKSLHGGANLPM